MPRPAYTRRPCPGPGATTPPGGRAIPDWAVPVRGTSYGTCRNLVTLQPMLPDRTVAVRESIPSFDGYTLSHPEPGRAGQQSSRGSCCTQSNVLRLRKITGSWSFQRRGMAELRCPRRPFSARRPPSVLASRGTAVVRHRGVGAAAGRHRAVAAPFRPLAFHCCPFPGSGRLLSGVHRRAVRTFRVGLVGSASGCRGLSGSSTFIDRSHRVVDQGDTQYGQEDIA